MNAFLLAADLEQNSLVLDCLNQCWQIRDRQLLLFSCQVVSYSFAHLWTIAPSGSSVHGILQARILEWVAVSSSKGSSQPRDWTRISCLAGRFFTTEPPEVDGATAKTQGRVKAVANISIVVLVGPSSASPGWPIPCWWVLPSAWGSGPHFQQS